MRKYVSAFLFSFIMIIGLMFTSQAQKAPVKFGDIDKADLEMTVYEKDSSASAVVLFDFGYSHFIYTDKNGFQLVFERHTRIKIFNKDGYDWANVSIPVYHDDYEDKENVGTIKAYTYNLNNGNVVKEMLSNSAKFNEETGPNWSQIKFAMPNVKEGSIIEYKYSITSDFLYNFRNWQFQYTIPVLWSEYIAQIPEYFFYNMKLKGFEDLFINEKETNNKKFIFTYLPKSGIGTTRREKGGVGGFDVKSNDRRWVAKDVPAFRKENYMTASSDFLSMIEFELACILYPEKPVKNFSSSWETINTKLLQNNDNGRQGYARLLDGGSSFMKEQIGLINNKYNNPSEKMLAAFDFVKNHMKWDGHHGIYVRKSLRKTYKEKSGSVADINLLLTMILQKLDFDAHPVVLSTRKNGFIHPSHPSISSFNYVVACVIYGDNQFLLDATDPLNVVNMLPHKCLNGRGRLVRKEEPDWVNLYTDKPKLTVSISDFVISENGVISGKSKSFRMNYAAFSLRKDIEEATNEDEFIEKLEKNKNGLKVSSYTFENLKDLYEPVNIVLDVQIDNQVEVMGDMMFFSPLLYDQWKESPFKLEKRLYPVDYGYKIEETNIYKYTIPAGYVVDEKPESIALSLLGGEGKFTYNVSVAGNTIQIMSIFNINKSQFLPEEYKALKNFYNQVIAKHAEQIILKKN